MKVHLMTGCLFLLLSAACGPVLSLQPLWNAENEAEEPRLTGTWATADDWFRIAQVDKGRYSLTYHNKEGVSRYDARLVQLERELFLDLTPQETSLADAFFGQAYLSVVPTHFFVRVRLEGDRMRAGLLEKSTLEELVKIDPALCSYQKVGDEFLLTGSTEELQQLVKAVAGSDAWDETEYKAQPSSR